MHKYYLYALLFLNSLNWVACDKVPLETYSGAGKRPIYLPVSELNHVENLDPQTVENSGAIFLKDTLFFMLEQKKGIHVFDIKDSLNIRALTFLRIPAVTDFTISGNRLYADSWKDLLTIDISDLYHIQLLDRQVDAFDPLLYPPLYNGIFECVDESKGAVVGWENVYLDDARCRVEN